MGLNDSTAEMGSIRLKCRVYRLVVSTMQKIVLSSVPFLGPDSFFSFRIFPNSGTFCSELNLHLGILPIKTLCDWGCHTALRDWRVLSPCGERLGLHTRGIGTVPDLTPRIAGALTLWRCNGWCAVL